MKGTVVIISIVHWHFTWQIQHNIARGLAERGYQILYVEPLPKRWPKISEFGRLWGRLTGNSRAAGICEQPLIPGVELIAPRLIPDNTGLTQSLNRRVFVSRIAEQLRARVQQSPLFVINYLPTPASIDLMHRLKADATFYHCVNDWEHDPFAPNHYEEKDLAAVVDMIWADSGENFRRTSVMNKRAIKMPTGVDVALFAKARQDKPSPSKDILCAYFGTIRPESIDFDILRTVSQQHHLRLIGPVRHNLDGFAPHTEIIGPVPQEQVPALLRDADVLLLPYGHNAHNKSVMPAKLFECLATGKPTIVSGLELEEDYADLFYVCQTEQAYMDAIASAIHEPNERKDARIAFAKQHSYDQRFNEIEGYFQEILHLKDRGEEGTPDTWLQPLSQG